MHLYLMNYHVLYVDVHTALSVMFMSCCKKIKKIKKSKRGVGFGVSSLGRLIFFPAAVVTEDFVSSAARLRRRSNTTSRTSEHSGCLPARTCCQATQPIKKKKKKQDRSVKSPLILFPLSKFTEASFLK